MSEKELKISVKYTTLIVENREKSVEFYRDILGFKEEYSIDFPGGGITIMKSLDGACVELIQSPQYDLGFYSIGTDVENLDDTLESLKAKGCEPISPIVEISAGRMTFIKDPNSIKIALIEHTDEYKEKYLK